MLRDRVILWVNTASLDAAIMVARDMRSCTRTISVGPNFFLANGPSGVRCFYELGIYDVLLDLRLAGSPKEIWQCVIAAAELGAKAITISAFAGQQNIKYAIEAAEASKAITHKIARPKILLSTLPVCITDADMIDELGMRLRRPGHVELIAQSIVDTEADGIVIDYDDIKYVKRVNRKLPFLVYSQRRARNYLETESRVEKGKAGITEIIKAGASHVIFDSEFVSRTNVEWAADMITKEVEAIKGRKR